MINKAESGPLTEKFPLLEDTTVQKRVLFRHQKGVLFRRITASLDFFYQEISKEVLEDLQNIVLAYKYKKSSLECQRYLKVKLIYFMRETGSENFVDLYYARQSFLLDFLRRISLDNL